MIPQGKCLKDWNIARQYSVCILKLWDFVSWAINVLSYCSDAYFLFLWTAVRTPTLAIRPKSGGQNQFSPTSYVKPMIQGFTIGKPTINLSRLPTDVQNRPTDPRNVAVDENSLNSVSIFVQT